ncbi:hypothetical protein [Paenibacillus pinihumi]|uniref:hypothetical protein n=1 Tax=Paenibacillus pinihumi TaxID=669462 RepID=UPI00041F0386|nr:hypothetical protein [Paenibacillus pinihumi]
MTIKIQKWVLAAMLGWMCLIMLDSGAAAANGARDHKPVQIFDIQAGKVVKTMENDQQFQQYAAGWLASVSGLSPQFTPENKCGYVFRVPLEQPIEVKAGEIKVTASDVFLFYCPEKPASLLIFDAERKPYILSFKSDLKPFLRKVGLPAQ